MTTPDSAPAIQSKWDQLAPRYSHLRKFPKIESYLPLTGDLERTPSPEYSIHYVSLERMADQPKETGFKIISATQDDCSAIIVMDHSHPDEKTGGGSAGGYYHGHLLMKDTQEPIPLFSKTGVPKEIDAYQAISDMENGKADYLPPHFVTPLGDELILLDLEAAGYTQSEKSVNVDNLLMSEQRLLFFSLIREISKFTHTAARNRATFTDIFQHGKGVWYKKNSEPRLTYSVIFTDHGFYTPDLQKHRNQDVLASLFATAFDPESILSQFPFVSIDDNSKTVKFNDPLISQLSTKSGESLDSFLSHLWSSPTQTDNPILDFWTTFSQYAERGIDNSDYLRTLSVELPSSQELDVNLILDIIFTNAAETLTDRAKRLLCNATGLNRHQLFEELARVDKERK